MQTPLSYYGSKARLAPWIVSLFPEHRVYVEPFCGSAAVLFAKHPARHEIINDLDDNVVTFMRVLRDRPDELEAVCRATPYARAEFDACADLAVDDDLERARRWWVRSSQSFAKLGSAAAGWSVSIKSGANNARSAWNRLGRFAEAAERLATVTIENRDALEVLGRFDAPDAVAYLDPPYLGDTRTSYRDGRRPNGDYLHEFQTEVQHRDLAGVAREYSGTVLVSGYPSDLYDELYDGWYTAHRRIVRRTSNGRTSSMPHVDEVIWSNRPIADRLDLVWGMP